MAAFLYILQSQTSGKFYVGSTDDLDRRLSEHARNYTPSTRGRGPWTLVHKEEFAVAARTPSYHALWLRQDSRTRKQSRAFITNAGKRGRSGDGGISDELAIGATCGVSAELPANPAPGVSRFLMTDSG